MDATTKAQAISEQFATTNSALKAIGAVASVNVGPPRTGPALMSATQRSNWQMNLRPASRNSQPGPLPAGPTHPYLSLSQGNG